MKKYSGPACFNGSLITTKGSVFHPTTTATFSTHQLVFHQLTSYSTAPKGYNVYGAEEVEEWVVC
jgi:hypothetical protein